MDIQKMLKALGEPMRFTIYTSLLKRKHCVRSLSKKLGLTESAVSQHLKIMKEAELVYSEKFGHHTHFFPSQEALDLITGEFEAMRAQALKLDRDPVVCQCEFRKEENE